MSSNRYVKHNFGSTYSALHALNFYGQLYQSSHIVSNSRWDKVRYLMTKMQGHGPLHFGEPKFRWRLSARHQCARLSQQQRLYTSSCLFVQQSDDQPRSGQLISAPTTRPCGPLRVALVLEFLKRRSLRAYLRKSWMILFFLALQSSYRVRIS